MSPPFPFSFSYEEMNVILTALQERPWKEVNQLIQKIHAQVIEHGRAERCNEEVEHPTGADAL